MKYFNIGFYLLLAFLVTFPFVVLPRIVKVNKLECYSQYGICPEEIFSLTTVAAGKSLNDAKASLANQFKNNGLVENYTFTFKIPGTLRTDLILKKAKFALCQKDSVETALLDKDGWVLQRTEETNLPKVIGRDDLPAVGERTGADKLFALNLIYSLNFYYQVDFGEITDLGLVVKMPGGPRVVFPLEGDQETLLGALKLILSGSQRLKLIDLRFKNPIIK